MIGKLIATTALIIASAGTSFAKEPVPHHTCLRSTPQGLHTCDAYIGKAMNDKVILNSASKSCSGEYAKWLTNAQCPTQNRVGVCKFSQGKPGEMWTVLYGDKPLTPDAAKNHASQCEGVNGIGGKWSMK